MQALEALAEPPPDVEFFHFITTDAVPHDSDGHCTTKYRHRSFFVGSDIRTAVREGKAEYVPMPVSRVARLIEIGRMPVDVALVQVSAPDPFGYVSLGVSVDIAHAAVGHASLVIAEVNPAMPVTMGNSMLHVDRIDWLVPVTTPVIEYVHERVGHEVVEQIARYIAGIIEDQECCKTDERLRFVARLLGHRPAPARRLFALWAAAQAASSACGRRFRLTVGERRAAAQSREGPAEGTRLRVTHLARDVAQGQVRLGQRALREIPDNPVAQVAKIEFGLAQAPLEAAERHVELPGDDLGFRAAAVQAFHDQQAHLGPERVLPAELLDQVVGVVAEYPQQDRVGRGDGQVEHGAVEFEAGP